ncbi:MAG TPA: ABC transporter permease [Pyrinomonadaceae bacterium]|jgi:putative ABC transport system permease protein|nr:ABC transporter permease [Pyrinomonadaceae bacterium]
MHSLFKDIQYGVRGLLKRPGFTIIAAITLALGIGANCAIFTVVNSVLLRPLPFPQSEEIAVLEGINPNAGITESNMSVPDFADWQSQNQVFAQLAGFVTGGMILANGDDTERVRGTAVTTDFFPLFRTNAALGRTFAPDDSRKGVEPVAVLSDSLWQRRFGADPNVIGTKVTLSGKSATIVGVMPPGFDYPAQTEMWGVFNVDAGAERRDNRFLNVIARLKPGVTPAQAKAQLDTINQRLAQTYYETNNGWTVKVTNLRERMVGSLRLSLFVLLGAVAFVLLIACANVANLLLARATVRAKEMALRTALGASRWRIIRQLLIESMLLSIVGGVTGVLLSVWLTKLLIAISPPNSPRFNEVKPDLRVLIFTIGLTLFTGFVFGLVPAFQSSRVDLNERLKEGGRGGMSGGHHNRMRSLMMVSEIALSFMLLVGAGLLIKSFMRLRDVSPGFTASNLLSVRLSAGKYSNGVPRAQFFRQAVERLNTLPGIQSSGAVLSLPLGGDTFNVGRAYIREGRPATPEESGNAAYLVTMPDYFRTMQIPLLAGRTFTEQDTGDGVKVMIVNETMAKQLWPGQSPVGKRLTIWRDEKFPREIIGVVGDIKESLDAEAGSQMYVPYAQDANWSSLSFVIRTNGDPLALAAGVRNELRSLDKAVPVFNVKSMDEVLATSVAPRRIPMLLLSAFAGVALLLAMIGIYGVTSYYVTQRTREIGIRMALGAQIGDVMRLVLKGGMVLAVLGIVIGLAGSFVLTRLMTSLLFGVNPTDVVTFAVVSLALLATALLASYLPARRATKVDPLIALRYE